ncbi:hypothetical protein BH10ACI3_BH10ACI3_02020 [soil metagenome]
MSILVETTQTPDRITFSFPNEKYRPEEIREIVSLLKVALIARKSTVTAEDAEAISEEVKASWWNANRSRILNMIEKNG